MKQSEIKELSVSDLKDALVNSQAKLKDLKLTHQLSPLDNPSEINKMRKTIARINTEFSKRELE
ncbi:LSU ribosomal protein L29P [Psychroflexus salarius]|uniref:Large ribosomal subunit protein uL29 n=1 Tax=Psychroflexus salarius TaxID=1155689 RepID=A0A1M4U9H2_9FLAO|nr:50S ribosomal protein L29 [Psychroflexus salarius]SHE53334.1 LSU ribosomal protein L29P [Psychroflexus salarius]